MIPFLAVAEIEKKTPLASSHCQPFHSVIRLNVADTAMVCAESVHVQAHKQDQFKAYALQCTVYDYFSDST